MRQYFDAKIQLAPDKYFYGVLKIIRVDRHEDGYFVVRVCRIGGYSEYEDDLYGEEWSRCVMIAVWRDIMKLISWNVNGLRACIKKDSWNTSKKWMLIFLYSGDWVARGVGTETPGYHNIELCRKGYSGVAIFSKVEPLGCTCGIGREEHDKEGRVIALEYDDIHCYGIHPIPAGAGKAD